MTTTNSTATDQVEGLVEAVRPTGVKVQGIWASVSQFHPVPLPDMGARVRLEIDGKRFIRTVQVLDAAPASASTSSSDRIVEIRRMACLKAAATFCGGKALNTEVSSQDVLKIAEAFERWVTRDSDA